MKKLRLNLTKSNIKHKNRTAQDTADIVGCSRSNIYTHFGWSKGQKNREHYVINDWLIQRNIKNK